MLPELMPKRYGIAMRGCSVFLHDDPIDRDSAVYGGTTTIQVGEERKSYVLLSFILWK